MSDISMQIPSKHCKITFRTPAGSIKCYTANKVPMQKISVPQTMSHILGNCAILRCRIRMPVEGAKTKTPLPENTSAAARE